MIRLRRQVGLLVLLAAFAYFPSVIADEVVTGNFELLDHDGELVTEQTYAGKIRLVFFGFTRCPDVCPTTLLEVRNALQLLGDEAVEVQPLFVSVDSDYDSPQQLAIYVAYFHPSLIGLSGTAEQIAAAAESFNVTYGVQATADDNAGSDEIFHTAYLFLMDRDGKFLDVMGYGTRAERIAEMLRRYL